MWIGEKTEFKFDVATDVGSGAEQPILIETVTSAWTVSGRLRALCEQMAVARGHGTANHEVERVLRGHYEVTRRELDRQGGHAVAALLIEDVTADQVTDRLRVFEQEANHEFCAAAYVLDAALAKWGYFMGNVRFEDKSRPGVTVTHTIPETAEELAACLEPWLDQLPHDEAREAFRGAVAAARALEGAKCRELVELASASVPLKVEAIADTEPPEPAP